jgi:hypothetical protein
MLVGLLSLFLSYIIWKQRLESYNKQTYIIPSQWVSGNLTFEVCIEVRIHINSVRLVVTLPSMTHSFPLSFEGMANIKNYIIFMFYCYIFIIQLEKKSTNCKPRPSL